MKKVFLFACVTVLAFASCGNKTANNVDEVDSTVGVTVPAGVQNAADSLISIVKEQIATGDAAKLQSVFGTVQSTYAQLVNEGKLEDAKKYASVIQTFVAENSDKLNILVGNQTTVVALIESIKKLPTSSETTVEQAAAAVKADAKTIATSAETAAKAAVDAKVDEAKAAAAAKVAEKTAPVVEKVNEAKSAADAAKNKVEEKKTQVKAVGDAAKTLLGR